MLWMMRNNNVRILEKVNAEPYARFLSIVVPRELNKASTVVVTAWSAQGYRFLLNKKPNHNSY
ncbi:hypothetical protein KXD40_004774 [Peronospora effusa]|nr:hypothetical protein KXD40_004774 [Peronospora effusa]